MSATVSVRVTEKQLVSLRTKSESMGITVSALIRRLIQQDVGGEPVRRPGRPSIEDSEYGPIERVVQDVDAFGFDLESGRRNDDPGDLTFVPEEDE